MPDHTDAMAATGARLASRGRAAVSLALLPENADPDFLAENFWDTAAAEEEEAHMADIIFLSCWVGGGE